MACKNNCCGNLYYANTCPICRGLAKIIKFLDKDSRITLIPKDYPGELIFERTYNNTTTTYKNMDVAAQVVAELLNIEKLKFPLDILCNAIFYLFFMIPAAALDKLHP